MSTTILRIKRSTTAGNPGTLAEGELAYSAANPDITPGGGRLYVGIGAEVGGDAASHLVIGGEYFTGKLDHALGTLTPNSAILVDGDSKIDNLKIDNLDFNGNTISSTDVNGNIVLSTNGSGLISADSTRIVNVANPVSDQDAVTKQYIESGLNDVSFNAISAAGNVQIDGNLVVGGSTTTISAQNLSVADNMIFLNNPSSEDLSGAVGNGTDVVFTTATNHQFLVGMHVKVAGVTPSSFDGTYTEITAVTADTFTVASTNTDTYVSGGTARGQTSANPDLGWAAGYDDGTYGHAGFFRDATDGIFKVFDGYIPEPDTDVFIDTSDASFSLSDIQAENFYGSLQGNALSSNEATRLSTVRTFSLSGDATGSQSFDGQANADIAMTLASTGVIPGTYGAFNEIPVISVDEKGRLTVASASAVSITSAGITDFDEAAQDAMGLAIGNGNQTNISVTYDDLNNAIDYSIETATAATLGVAKFSTDNFLVTAGNVEVIEVNGGTYA